MRLLLVTEQRGLSVCHTSEPCKTGYIDQDAVWAEDLGGPREPCIRWGSRSLVGRGNFDGGEAASHCKVLGHSAVICAKTTELIEMPFGLWAWMGPRNHVLEGCPQMLRDVAMTTNFGTQFAITGDLAFDEYNFGCMISKQHAV